MSSRPWWTVWCLASVARSAGRPAGPEGEVAPHAARRDGALGHHGPDGGLPRSRGARGGGDPATADGHPVAVGARPRTPDRDGRRRIGGTDAVGWGRTPPRRPPSLATRSPPWAHLQPPPNKACPNQSATILASIRARIDLGRPSTTLLARRGCCDPHRMSDPSCTLPACTRSSRRFPAKGMGDWRPNAGRPAGSRVRHHGREELEPRHPVHPHPLLRGLIRKRLIIDLPHEPIGRRLQAPCIDVRSASHPSGRSSTSFTLPSHSTRWSRPTTRGFSSARCVPPHKHCQSPPSWTTSKIG